VADNVLVMDSFDSAGLPAGGSRLLSQSPQFSFASASSNTAQGGDDLSLSELYPDNRVPGREIQARRNLKTRPSIAQALGFGASLDQSGDDQSLLGALDGEVEEDAGEGDIEAVEADVTVRIGGEDADRTSIAVQSREENLQSDLFVLRQLNGAFAVYNDALREAQTGTEVSCSCSPASVNLLMRVLYYNYFAPSVLPSSSSRQTRCSTST
jgi:hypothetical protein